jgi:methylenetetrahydrofolate dehydrogenase (NADP+)/methenyltetrahydrofolate cyclohydrolase
MNYPCAVSAIILDGKKIAAELRAEAAAEARTFRELAGRSPKLQVFLVGEDPASTIYVRNKSKAAEEAGIEAPTTALPAQTSLADLLARLAEANRDASTDGILVQMPLPSPIDSRAVLDAVDPEKDVDGFHPVNVGLLHQGRPRFVPCTPAGIMELLSRYGIAVEGRRAVVVGRSEIVGKPMAALLLARNATVTTAHSRTRDLSAVCREAEILVAAIGRAKLFGRNHVAPGATVIDVGITRREGKLSGDVDFEAVRQVAGAITPVPGGVGPLTIAMLLKNTAKAARLRRGEKA